MGRKAEIVEASIDHIAHIAANLRPGDRAELEASGRTPEAALSASLRMSRRAWTGLIDGVPVCMFGVAPSALLTPQKGRPWMLGTSALDRNAVHFLRRCRPVLEEMFELFPELENYVAVSNAKAVNWLRWMGFNFSADSVPVGIRRVPFVKFFMEVR